MKEEKHETENHEDRLLAVFVYMCVCVHVYVSVWMHVRSSLTHTEIVSKFQITQSLLENPVKKKNKSSKVHRDTEPWTFCNISVIKHAVCAFKHPIQTRFQTWLPFPQVPPSPHPNNLAPPCNNISNQNHSETEYRQTENYSLFQAVTHFLKKDAMWMKYKNKTKKQRLWRHSKHSGIEEEARSEARFTVFAKPPQLN